MAYLWIFPYAIILGNAPIVSLSNCVSPSVKTSLVPQKQPVWKGSVPLSAEGWMRRLRFQEHSISLLRYFWNRIDSIWGVHGDTTVGLLRHFWDRIDSIREVHGDTTGGPLQSTQSPTFLVRELFLPWPKDQNPHSPAGFTCRKVVFCGFQLLGFLIS